jgi:hypothetical protein
LRSNGQIHNLDLAKKRMPSRKTLGVIIMTPRQLIIFLILTVPTFLIGQLKPVFISKHFDKEYDCNYFAEINKPKTDIDKQRLYIRCLVYDHRNLSRAIFMLDSLNGIYKNDNLFNDKTSYLAFFKPYDTTYFSMQRQLIDKKYSIPYSFAQMGMYYMNYVAICSTDSSKTKLTTETKIRLLELSSYFFSKSLSGQSSVKEFSFIFLPDVLNELQSLKGVKLKKLSESKVSDSLIIIAHIPDCGEFGGHFEYIKFYKKNDSLSVQFTHDSTTCQSGFVPDKQIFTPARQKMLIKDNILSRKFFKSIDTEKEKRGSNAPLDIYVYLDNKFYEFSEWDGKSATRDEYEAFKKDVFK